MVATVGNSIRELDDERFLGDPNVRCRVYEWSVPHANRFGQLKVRFLCPIDEGPRRFFVQPVMENWMNAKKQRGLKNQNRFLERACRCGDKILAALDPSPPGQRELFPILLALFRNRNEGHGKVGRQFTSILDFGDFKGKQSSPGSIAIGLTEREFRWCGNARRTIQHLLSHRSANDVIEEYQTGIEVDWADNIKLCHPSLARLDELYGRSTIDLLFTDGVWRSSGFDFQRAMGNVRRALIYGPCDRSDFSAAVADPEFRSFAGKISKGVKGRSHAEFEKWLRNHRQHGSYVKLLRPEHRVAELERKPGRVRARRMFCAMLWLSYQEMARCYGVLMLVCWSELSLELKLTREEDALFRQINFPQLYLAGLPLANPRLFNRLRASWSVFPK